MSKAAASYSATLNGRALCIGIVQARWNAEITGPMREQCVAELVKLGVDADAIQVIQVPGALEIPLALQMLVQAGGVDGLVAIGCVVRGDTYHFEIVCNESCRGVSDVALTTGLPIANAILTVENQAQAVERIEKGRDAARVVVEMICLGQHLRQENDESVV